MDAPDHLSDTARVVWLDVTRAYGAGAEAIMGPSLDAFCAQVAILREAQARVLSEGQVIADPKGFPIPHPSLAIAKAAQAEVTRMEPRFRRRRQLKRRSGPMYDATRRSVRAAKHLANRSEFEGVIETACTTAWLIDEAQRAGAEALAKTVYGAIPMYLKACAALQITPADAPTAADPAPKDGAKSSGRRSKMRMVTTAAS